MARPGQAGGSAKAVSVLTCQGAAILSSTYQGHRRRGQICFSGVGVTVLAGEEAEDGDLAVGAVDGKNATIYRAKDQVRIPAFFSERPVFSLEEAASALPGGKERVYQRLQHYVKTKRLKAVARGVYAAIPAGRGGRRFQPDPFLVAAAARVDAVFAFHSALELLGVAHSEWTRCTVCTARRRVAVRLGRARIDFLGHPPGLRRSGQTSLGVRTLDRLGRTLTVTGPERTLVDGFRRPDRVGGLAELLESASGFGVLDLKLLARLLGAYGEKSLWAASGWFLERYRRTFFTPDAVLRDFESQRPKAPHYLLPRHRGGRFVRRWNLIIPEGLIGSQEANEA